MTGAELALHGDDERALANIMARARIIAKMPGLKKELAGNTDAVAAAMMSLQGYGLPMTAPSLNDSFDWIEGRATLTAQAYQALAHKNGYDIIPVARTAERAVARVERPGRPPIEAEYTLDDAERSGRLDEWVERWVKVRGDDNRDRNRLEKFVIGSNGRRRRTVVDGEEIPVEYPDWVTAKIRAGEVKRSEAWWKYRTDMLWKSAAKRAVKIAAPHVLLGVMEDDHHEVAEWAGPADAAEEIEVVDVSGRTEEPDDPNIVDAELVEDPPESTVPRPVADPPAAQATDATEVAADPATGEIRAPAGEQLFDDGRPFE